MEEPQFPAIKQFLWIISGTTSLLSNYYNQYFESDLYINERLRFTATKESIYSTASGRQIFCHAVPQSYWRHGDHPLKIKNEHQDFRFQLPWCRTLEWSLLMPSEQQKAVLCLLCTHNSCNSWSVKIHVSIRKTKIEKSLRQQYLLCSRPESKLKDSFLVSVLHVSCQSAPSSKKQ